MNKQLSVMGLAARASMVPVLIASGLTALAVGALTYLANPEHTGGAAGVGAAPLAAALGCLMVMVMLCLGGCGFGSQTAYTVRRLRLREELVDLWWAAYHAAMLLVLWALVATAALLGMQLKLQGLEPNWGVGPQSLMLLVYSDSFLHHLVPLADAAVYFAFSNKSEPSRVFSLVARRATAIFCARTEKNVTVNLSAAMKNDVTVKCVCDNREYISSAINVLANKAVSYGEFTFTQSPEDKLLEALES